MVAVLRRSPVTRMCASPHQHKHQHKHQHTHTHTLSLSLSLARSLARRDTSAALPVLRPRRRVVAMSSAAINDIVSPVLGEVRRR